MMTGYRRWAFYALAVPIGINLFVVLSPHGSTDFVAFFLAGRALAAGRNPYGIYADLAPESGGAHITPNLNPPVSLLLFRHLAGPASIRPFYIWVALSAAMIAACVVLLSRAYSEQVTAPDLLWTLGLAGLGHTLFLGQIYAPLALCACGAWILLDRQRHIWAGILIGLIVAIKPNVIIWPIVLLVAGAPAAGIASFVVAGGLSLLALLLLGPGIYIQWLDASAKTLATVVQAPLSMSFTMVTTRLGLPWLGTLLSVAVAAGVVWWAWRYKPNLHDAGSAALSASIVAAPVAWPGYTLLLLPAFLTRRLTSRLWRASAVGLVMPFALVDITASHLPWLGSKLGAVYTLSLLAVLIAVCRPPRALRPPGHPSPRPRSGENTQAVTKSP